MNKPFVLTIVGAESSGKTFLAKQLAHYFSSHYVEEYARSYLSNLGRPYTFEDLNKIATTQMNLIREACEQMHPKTTEFNSNPFPFTTLVERIILFWNKLLPGLVTDRKMLVIDGGSLNIKMWAQLKYNKEIPLIEEDLKNDITDLYILCRPMRKWEPDPLREAPSSLQRAWIYNHYLAYLSATQKPFLLSASD